MSIEHWALKGTERAAGGKDDVFLDCLVCLCHLWLCKVGSMLTANPIIVILGDGTNQYRDLDL